MARRPSDPNARRLRRFVLLVIFAVTLPSLLLSGFGLIAISNERDAARQRVFDLYDPVVRKLAVRLKTRLKSMIEASQVPLAALADWESAKVGPPSELIDGYLRAHPALANFFVIDSKRKLLLSGAQASQPASRAILPEAFLAGRELEFERGDLPGAVAVYRSLLGEVDGESVRCRTVNALRLGLGRPDLFSEESCEPGRAEGVSHSLRCQTRNALARALDRSARKAEAIDEWARLADECPRFVDPGGYNLALGARLRRLELLWPLYPQQALATGNDLAAALVDPLLPASVGQKRFAARKAAALLAGVPLTRAVHGLFEHVASADRLLNAKLDLETITEDGVALRSVLVDGARRMVVIARRGDQMVGAEVVAAMLEPDLQALLEKLELGPHATARIRPATQPFSEEAFGLLAGSTLLTDGEFAWRLDLSLEGGDALDELTRTRARLYLWLLVLLVVVLAIGIAGTVWVMVRETRLSRLKTDFVSNVSHELRTPLTSIRLFTETLLLGREGSEEERLEFLRIISRESERLSRLVERILDFSRMEAGRKAYSLIPVEARELVAAASSACHSLVEERGVALQVDLPDDLPSIPADRDALVEVLINLLSNAIKYSPAGSRVSLAGVWDGDWVELAVTDCGIGIPRAEQERIFDKFYRVETPLAEEVSGSGLGLSLVRYIVDGHGGEVLIDSSPGKGSTFTVRLPLGPSGLSS